MNKKTLTALKGSIRKWKKIVAGTGRDHGRVNCPLCKIFNTMEYLCIGCPVAKKVGRKACLGTPYYDWQLHISYCTIYKDMYSMCPTCNKLAEKELRFLQSLLPTGVKMNLSELIKNHVHADGPVLLTIS